MQKAKQVLFAVAAGLLLVNTVACTKFLSAVMPALAATCAGQ